MAFELPNRQQPISDNKGLVTRFFYRWFERLVRDLNSTFEDIDSALGSIKKSLEVIGANVDDLAELTSFEELLEALENGDIEFAIEDISIPVSFYILNTDDDPPTLPDAADETDEVLVLTRRTSGRYKFYIWEP